MKKQYSSAGFTLIEIMVVIVILTILVGIVVGASKYAITKGQRSRAQSEISMMENALESYKSDNGVYPPSTAIRSSGSGFPAGAIEISNSGSLYFALAGGTKVYMTFKPNQLKTTTTPPVITYIVDPFGSSYNYYCNGGAANQTNSATFDLWSYGPDGQNDTGDDITNWKQN